jgi:hypothetical protein
MGSSAPRPTPNPEDQGISLSLAPPSKPVRHGGPTNSYAAAGIALEFIGAHKPPRPATKCFGKVEIPSRGPWNLTPANNKARLYSKWTAKLSLYRHVCAKGDRTYSFCSFFTSALDGASITPPPCFTPRKGPPVPIGWEAGWFSELVWTQSLEEKSFSSAGDRTLVVQSVVRHCADWGTPAPLPTL